MIVCLPSNSEQGVDFSGHIEEENAKNTWS